MTAHLRGAGRQAAGEVIFITHPEVVQDPQVPVPQWSLSALGRRRMQSAVGPWLVRVGTVWASEEPKASEAARLLASERSIPVRLLADLGEIDRSATGYLPPAEHAENTVAFYGTPTRSARGWETAVDAQRRIAAAVEVVLDASPPGDVIIVAHGAVGTLLLCSLKNTPIVHEQDQPSPGHAFVFSRDTRELIHGWIGIERLANR